MWLRCLRAARVASGVAKHDGLGGSSEAVVVSGKPSDRLRRRRSQWNVMPPLMPMTSPLTKLAAGEAR